MHRPSKQLLTIGALLITVWTLAGLVWAAPEENSTQEKDQKQAIEPMKTIRVIGSYEPLTYTVGADDVIDIIVRRHPEFSGSHLIGRDGKIQYRFVGDIYIAGLTKAQIIEKLKEPLSAYVVDPEIDVVITEFRSKVVYVVGEVGRPGRYFLRSDSVPLREVIFEAGLPTLAASMRRTLIVHPQIAEGKNKGEIPIDKLNLYALLYLGDLTKNVPIKSGDILYVPSTVFHKASRILDPFLDPVYKAAVARRLVE